jgi:hypothetical protein
MWGRMVAQEQANSAGSHRGLLIVRYRSSEAFALYAGAVV